MKQFVKSLICDPLFCSIVTLQLSAITLTYGVNWGDSIPLSALADRWNGARFEARRAMPDLAVYDQVGQRQPLVTSGAGVKAILLKSTCSCDENTVASWKEMVRAGKQDATLVLPFGREEAEQTQRRLGWKKRMVRVHPQELLRLGLLGSAGLPLLVRVDESGMILGVTHE